MIRLGGPVTINFSDPEHWVAALKEHGYTAAYCPVDVNASEFAIHSYAIAAQNAGVVIAEVGAWSNPLSTDEKQREEACAHCEKSLALADEIGARCCVNIAGSCGQRWDEPHPDNLTEETFDRIVEVVRSIIDAVKPERTYYTLETMPWMFPDSPDSYLRLIRAIDRERFAVHLDPVNLVCSPQLYYSNGALIRECFEKLGPYIKSCHAKDIILRENLTVHLDEVVPGQGALDYRVFLQELSKLGDIPLMLEHLELPQQYTAAAEHIRTLAHEEGISIKAV